MRSRAGALVSIVALVAVMSVTCADGSKSSPASPASPTSPAACTTGEITAPKWSTTTGGSSQPIGISGGSFSASLTVTGNCQWTATSDAPWLTPEAPGTGVGSGVLAYRAASNASVARQARLTLFAGQPNGVLNIRQDGPVAAAGCAYELRPPARSVSARLSPFEVQVWAPYGCPWAFEGNGSWITVQPEDDRPSPWGDGNGTVLVVVAENTSAGPRTGTAVIAGRTLGVTQDGTATPACQYALTPTAQSISAVGGGAHVSVSTAAGCSWSIEDVITDGPPTWVHITDPVSRKGSGPGRIALTLDGNAATTRRTVQLLVEGDSGNARMLAGIEQSGATCVYTVSPSSSNWSTAGGRAGMTVDARPGPCSWQATSDAGWITIDAGASGTGGGLVEFRVSPNTTGAPRSGEVVVSGLSGLNPSARHRVTQAAQ